MTVKKELTALNKDIKALGKKVDSLLKAVDKSGKAKATQASTARTVKAKTTKRVLTRQKAVGLTATDKVLRIINRSKKGVNTATLMEETGFDQKKVWNIIHRAYKTGKIRRLGKGLYVGVKEG
jgi:cob(I)alamin adenosyltransferase